MLPSRAEVLNGLEAALAALLPPPADPASPPTVALARARLAPVGVGGFVGLSREPEGEIGGRRLDATVRVTVRGATSAALAAEAAAIREALLGAERAVLAAAGIQRLTQSAAGEPRPQPGGGGLECDLDFGVGYELLRAPLAGEAELIDTVPLDLRLPGAEGGGE